MYSYGSPHMAAQKQDDQHERTFSCYVRIRDVVLKTYLGRWTIGRSGERGSGISVLPAQYDDDDIHILYIFLYIYYINILFVYIYIYKYIYIFYQFIISTSICSCRIYKLHPCRVLNPLNECPGYMTWNHLMSRHQFWKPGGRWSIHLSVIAPRFPLNLSFSPWIGCIFWSNRTVWLFKLCAMFISIVKDTLKYLETFNSEQMNESCSIVFSIHNWNHLTVWKQ